VQSGQYSHHRINSPATADAYVEWNVTLAAGTWRFDMYVMTNTDKGIATIAIDGSSVGTLDTYAASEGQNVLKSLTGIAVAADQYSKDNYGLG